MSIFPNSSLANRVRALVTETFDVSDREAGEHATRLAALAEGWGDSKTTLTLDWSYRVKKELGKHLKWRSEAKREEFESNERRKFAAYEGLINKGKRRIL